MAPISKMGVMPTLRRATIADAALITEQRHRMFADNGFTTEERYREMDAAFEPWVRRHLADGTYVGLFLEEEGEVVSAAGIYFMEFPPHWMDPEPLRAYLLNFYTVPAARGRALASAKQKPALCGGFRKSCGTRTRT